MSKQLSRQAFLTLPGSCGGPPQATVSVDSWESPGVPMQGEAVPRNEEGNALSLRGCRKAGFQPHPEVQSESTTADTPSGFAVDVRMPQNEDPYGLAEADLRDAVTLPPGVSLNPAAADGLGACSAQQIGMDNAARPACCQMPRGSAPWTSKARCSRVRCRVRSTSPRLTKTRSEACSRFTWRQDDGVLLKLAGRIDANPGTGQLRSAIDTLQLPFTDLTLTFEGGPRAPLATPPGCGTFTTTSQLTPYSVPQAAVPTTPSSSFTVDQGCGGGFSPSFLAGATSVLAGHDTASRCRSRADGGQLIQSLSATLPPGLLARLSGVPLCMEAQAVAGTCDAASEIGWIVIAAGAGSDPFHFRGTGLPDGPLRWRALRSVDRSTRDRRTA